MSETSVPSPTPANSDPRLIVAVGLQEVAAEFTKAANAAREVATAELVNRYLSSDGNKVGRLRVPGIGDVCNLTVVDDARAKAVVTNPVLHTKQMRHQYPRETFYEVTVRVPGGFGASDLVTAIDRFIATLSETFGSDAFSASPSDPDRRWQVRKQFTDSLLNEVTEPDVDEKGNRAEVVDSLGTALEGVDWVPASAPTRYMIPPKSWAPGARERLLDLFLQGDVASVLSGQNLPAAVTAGTVVQGELVAQAAAGDDAPPGTT